jgi:hypothetical protein
MTNEIWSREPNIESTDLIDGPMLDTWDLVTRYGLATSITS